jgi:hypothetical protein
MAIFLSTCGCGEQAAEKPRVQDQGETQDAGNYLEKMAHHANDEIDDAKTRLKTKGSDFADKVDFGNAPREQARQRQEAGQR